MKTHRTRTHTTQAGPGLLTTRQVARMFGLSFRAVEEWRRRGRGPKFLQLTSRVVRYRREDVERWLQGREKGGGA